MHLMQCCDLPSCWQQVKINADDQQPQQENPTWYQSRQDPQCRGWDCFVSAFNFSRFWNCLRGMNRLCGLVSYLLDHCDGMSALGHARFCEKIALGAPTILRQIPGIKDVEVCMRPPCEKILVGTWEQRYSCQLPDDLKNFYLTTDGFKMTWKFKYGDDILPTGSACINQLSQLQKLTGFCTSTEESPLDLNDLNLEPDGIRKPNLSLRSKVFELDNCGEDVGWACLAYMPKPVNYDADALPAPPEEPSVWLLDRAFQWHFLAPNFSAYFRMMLVHLGLPQWQCRFTQTGLAPWAELVFSLVAPHLLQDKPSVREMDIQNTLDVSIFRRKKGTKGKNPAKEPVQST